LEKPHIDQRHNGGSMTKANLLTVQQPNLAVSASQQGLDNSHYPNLEKRPLQQPPIHVQ
jgi:hypothetical protein